MKETTHFTNFREYFVLLGINIRTLFLNFVEYVKVIFKYYLKNFQFAKTDFLLLLMYLFNSPYVFSKRFLQDRGEKDIYTYGETPLTTMDVIAKQCGIGINDTVYELGSGRGRTCFWMQAFLGAKVVGIDFVPEFIQKANEIKEKMKVPNIEFRLEDMLKANFSNATVIYLYGTTLEDKDIEDLLRKFERLSVGTKIITVSFPLTDYSSSESFEIMKCFPANYTWGTADVYFHIKK